MKPNYCILVILLCLNSRINFAQTSSSHLTGGRVDNANLCLTVNATANDNLNVKFYGRKINLALNATASIATTSTQKFKIILLPDTQYYTAEPQGLNGGSN